VLPIVDRKEKGNRSTRLAASAQIGRLGDRRATHALVDVLGQGDAELSSVAANSLATLGDSQALPALLPLFSDPHAAVRQAAVAAVSSIGADSTEQHVTARFSDPNAYVRECAIKVAGYFGYERAAQPLFEALSDPEETVRRAAIEQLPLRADDRAPHLLVQALQSETPRNRAAAAHAMRAVDHADIEEALLAAMRDPDPWVRYFAASSLGVHGRERATLVLSDVAENDDAPQVRIAALRSLPGLNSAGLSALVQRILPQADDDVACAALAALGATEDSLAAELLESTLHDSRSVRRLVAVDVLASRGTGEALRTLADAARLPVEPSLGPAVIAALGRVAASSHEVLARSAIASLFELGSEAEWRSLVIATLARLPHNIEWVRHGLSSVRPATRRRVVDGLGRMRQSMASSALIEALSDDDPTVRVAAVDAIGRLGSLGAAPAVAALRCSDPDTGVRQRAATVCDRYGWLDEQGRISG
jgi:HEAT repeat protein